MYQFDLIIKSREGIVYNGRALSLTSFNKKGRFDILPTHANFISLIQNKISFKTPDGNVKEIAITNALIRVRHDNVEVYLGIEAFDKN